MADTTHAWTHVFLASDATLGVDVVTRPLEEWDAEGVSGQTVFLTAGPVTLQHPDATAFSRLLRTMADTIDAHCAAVVVTL